ncbi:MAG: hypothetical protein HOL62_04345 [Candidatus Marinimicrobia bacterium]|jgi:hypothetical protein|nr:hypothetical protein [Candidatus Neomarinimicrobiota bacterium]MBT5251912.1 hypothetical protein [Candidatus Neomarinimicrobiota bacterium]MBT6867838.1 hypothetical protein [Candidatus Neomarinimicrobiota bacterium]MBT7434169.1 hypothetical protein [Candidatus Neomarinimicrobiota bacterium]
MEKIGYILITTFYLLVSYLTLQNIEQFYPDGLLVLLIYSGVFMLFLKVLKERLNNKEDDYYSKEINK